MYLTLLPTGRSGVLKVAVDSEQNDALNNEAVALKMLRVRAEEAEATNQGGKPYNFDLFFPDLVETFVSPTQGERRINILGFPEAIEVFTQLTPVSQIREAEGVRVDPRTSAWILGKLLKVLAFTHSQGISNGMVTGSNVLVERGLHGVILFDWTLCQIHPAGKVPALLVKTELMNAAKLTVSSLGTTSPSVRLPESDQLTDGRFEEFLRRLSEGKIASATEAHERFYELIESLWGRRFHPFTAYPI